MLLDKREKNNVKNLQYQMVKGRNGKRKQFHQWCLQGLGGTKLQRRWRGQKSLDCHPESEIIPENQHKGQENRKHHFRICED